MDPKARPVKRSRLCYVEPHFREDPSKCVPDCEASCPFAIPRCLSKERRLEFARGNDRLSAKWNKDRLKPTSPREVRRDPPSPRETFEKSAEKEFERRLGLRK